MAVISNSTVGTLVSGTSSADTIYNTGANVTIQALGGNDSVLNSNEYIEEDDDSSAYSLGSNAKISAGDGDGTIRNEYAYRVSIDGGKGYDSIYNSGSYASINGGDGSDEIYNDDGWSATINGGKGNDSIKNGGGYASIVSGDGDDTITNGYYYDQYDVYDGGGSSINAGKGNDYIENIGGNVLFTYAKGDGDDVIRDFNETSVLQISGGTYSTQLAYDDYYDEDYTGYYDILVKVGTGSILLEEVPSLSGLKIGTAA